MATIRTFNIAHLYGLQYSVYWYVIPIGHKINLQYLIITIYGFKSDGLIWAHL